MLDQEPSDAVPATRFHLTPREAQVLDHLMTGQLNKQIAHSLNISTRTVEHYRATLMLKMGGHNRADVIRIAALPETGTP